MSAKQKIQRTLENHWYRSSLTWFTFLLLPFSWLFHLIIYFRYRFYLKKNIQFPVPIVIVGNITVGGTGKTPFVIWLVEFLKAEGYRPGIVSRGVGGINPQRPYWVQIDSDPAVVGDEALLLARRVECPLVIGIDRVAAVQELLQKTTCNIVISDDGLQHYRLGRALEIAVVDGMRGFGNGRLLPAGPLREPEARLKRVDLVVVNGQVNSQWPEQSVFMHLQGDRLVSLQHHEKVEYFSSFPHKKIHAVAGIGHPERFFAVLRKNNFEIIEHVFPDHYLYRPEDITFADNLPVIMTEKDAVKCFAFANKQHWYLPVKAQVGAADIQKLLKRWREQDA